MTSLRSSKSGFIIRITTVFRGT